MAKPKDSAPGASRGAPDQQAPTPDDGAQSGAASVSSAAVDELLRVRAIAGASAISHGGREYPVDADGFVAITPDHYEPLRAVGAIVIG